MPFIFLTKPLQGEATKKALIDAIVDDLTYLNTLVESLRQVNIPNGSFEVDNDGDGVPDKWIRILFATSSAGVRVSGGGDMGQYSFKFTSVGGAGSGGGYLLSFDYFECGPLRTVQVSWQLKSSVANIRNKVELLWYDNAQNQIGSTVLYDNQTNNPTVWTRMVSAAYPPSTARYGKLRITGADSSNAVAGSVEFDDFQFNQDGLFLKQTTYDTAGTFTWICPANVFVARVTLIGGGGGGSVGATLNNANGGGGGGGGGQLQQSLVPVTPGTSYAIVVGAGGAAEANGSDSTFATTTVVAKGGTHGTTGFSGGAQTGGPGGTGGTGQLTIDGTAGRNGTLNAPPYNGPGGAGADSIQGQRGGTGGVYSGGDATAGVGYGAGGGGGNQNPAAAGAAGRAIIEY
jgi:hypothetical protein